MQSEISQALCLKKGIAVSESCPHSSIRDAIHTRVLVILSTGTCIACNNGESVWEHFGAITH